jgi:hypothetical protein
MNPYFSDFLTLSRVVKWDVPELGNDDEHKAALSGRVSIVPRAPT